MKKHLIYSFLILISLGFSFSSCKNKVKETGIQEKTALADSINQYMDRIMAFAAIPDADSAYQWLSDDSGAVFISQGMSYSNQGIHAMMRDMYKKFKSQSIEAIWSKTEVLSADAVVWTGVAHSRLVSAEDEASEQWLGESWIWHRNSEGWRVVHFHESWLSLPDPCTKATVENALGNFAKELSGRKLNPENMPSVLTAFLKIYPKIYGATLAFAPEGTGQNSHRAAPYLYRQNNAFKLVNLPESYDYTQSDWYRLPLEKNAPVWSDPYYDGGGGGVVMVTYAMPLKDKSGQLIGVLTSDVVLQ